MWSDILIAVGIGFSQLAVTWYGVDISVRDNRIRNAITIGLIGAAGIFLTVWGVVRSTTAQEHLQAQMDAIQHNTERPPQVTVNVPAPQRESHPAQVVLGSPGMATYAVGRPVAVNIPCTNPMDAEALNAWCDAKLFVVETKPIGIHGEPMVTAADQDASWKEFIAGKKNEKPSTLVKGRDLFTSALGPLLDTSLDAAFKDGSKTVLVTAMAGWDDDSGHHVTTMCAWLQQGFSIFHLCENHN